MDKDSPHVPDNIKDFYCKYHQQKIEGLRQGYRSINPFHSIIFKLEIENESIHHPYDSLRHLSHV